MSERDNATTGQDQGMVGVEAGSNAGEGSLGDVVPMEHSGAPVVGQTDDAPAGSGAGDEDVTGAQLGRGAGGAVVGTGGNVGGSTIDAGTGFGEPGSGDAAGAANPGTTTDSARSGEGR
jgi:hypothetical protein